MESIKPMEPMQPMKPMAAPEAWWPESLGQPSTTGSQNGMRYAFFPAKHRLLVETNGTLKTYDSGSHEISGVAQQDGGDRSIAFSDQHGTVTLTDLKVVD